ncbi:MAG: acyltransferase [Moorea sp. SIO4G2]|uniref:acyltransferase n=1 Tax=Moorena TaxID=1155738 RepID=UPI0009D724C5|nr:MULTISPECIES: acyltransferase [Moorena]NEO48583.1 acyltransferase [Moorena sp. SIO4A3]NEO61991.1 acyltransferase [Moorena sp. SIO4G2]NEO24406.1 acyltransferase [Moorena sp. SIO4A5]NEP28175.1 acyltransferase [Moorena sp. SIO3I6]NEQ63188.1 acyltransferase [Moorena sp. SIO4A1]
MYEFFKLINKLWNNHKQKIRHNYYRNQLGNIGEDCYIGKSVIKNNLSKLFLGNRVIVENNVTLKCNLEDSAIHIGDRSIIRSSAMLISAEGKIKIGSDCSVNPFCFLYGAGDLVIGNWVRIATHTVIVTSNYTFDDLDTPIDLQPSTKKGVIIEDDVWIGAGVRILDGCRIGKGSVIGAGTVLTKSVEPYSVVVGVPGKVIRKRGEYKDSKQE